MATITTIVERIKHDIEAYFESKDYAWKIEESQAAHAQQKPVVYPLVCAERNNANFPNQCPSITIEVIDVSIEANQQLQMNLLLHCVVVNSAIIEREKTIKSGDKYVFLDKDGFTENGVVEAIFSDCLLLAEETMNALRASEGVSNLKLHPPISLDDFPYCQCQVSAGVSTITQFIEDKSWEQFL